MTTIRDVAARAGVAASTVSYALSGNKKLPQETVERVKASALALGYWPSSTARALSLGRTKVLGMLSPIDMSTPDIDIDVFMRFVRAAVYTAAARGYDVLVVGRSDEDLVNDLLVDALIVMNVRTGDPRFPMLAERGFPVALVGMPDDSLGMSAVDLDFELAGREAVRHFFALGHRELALLAHPFDGRAQELAYRGKLRHGFLDEAERLGVTAQFRGIEATRSEVAAWLDETLEARPQLSAVFVQAVAVLDPLYAELEARGIGVPDDVSVAALAPAAQFRRLYPTTTVIDLPGEEMVRRAVTLALDELAGGPRGVLELLPVVLVDRGSCAVAGGGIGRYADTPGMESGIEKST